MELLYCILISVVFILDRISKMLALYYLQTNYVVNQFLSFILVKNNGIACGLMNNQENLHVFIVVITIIIYSLMMVYSINKWRQRKIIFAELLVLAGGLSNIIDRFYYGAVIDFIAFHYYVWMWPVFNIADAAIVIGICLILMQNFIYDDVKIA